MSDILALIRLILRRDRVRLPVWVFSLVVFLTLMVPVIQQSLGGSDTLHDLYLQFGANPAILFLVGPMDSASFGAAFTIKTLLWWGIAVAIMNILLVVRHTRANEETGTQEILLSTRVRRGADLVAVLSVSAIANGVIAAGIGGGLSAATQEISVEQGWLFGIGIGVTGFLWAVITGLIAQVVSSARGAYGVAAFLVGVAFVLRGVGDFFGTVSSSGAPKAHWISFLSPFGWLQETRPLTYPDWLPLWIFIVVSLAVLPAALWLVAHRDVGSGYLPERTGSSRATRLGRTSFGLTLVLHRTMWLGWTVGVVALMSVVGAIAPSMTSVYSSSEVLKRIIQSLGGTGAVQTVFFLAMLTIAVFVILAYAIQAIGLLYSEEASGHLDALLATSLGRWGWYSMHVAVVGLGCALALVFSGLVLGGAADLAGGSGQMGDYVGGALSYLPLLLVFIAAYGLFFGLLPRAAVTVVWAYFTFVVGYAWLGSLLRVPEWVSVLTPLHYIAAAPAEPVRILPSILLLIIAGTFFVIGGTTWRQRDVGR